MSNKDQIVSNLESLNSQINDQIERIKLELTDIVSLPEKYQVSASTENVDEGKSVIFTITTENVKEGTTISYTIQGSISSSDVDHRSGNLVIDSKGSASVTVNINSDELTEDIETLIFILGDNLASAMVSVIDKTIVPPDEDFIKAYGHDYKPPGDPNYTAWMEDTLDANKIPKQYKPWNVYIDKEKLTVAPHMKGVKPSRFLIMQFCGNVQGYAQHLAMLDDGKFLGFIPSASDKPDQAAGSLRAGYTEPRPGVRRKLFIKQGKRGEAVGSPYITWHGHHRRREDGTINYSVHVPMFIGVDVIGRFWAILRDGSLQHLGDVPIKTWSNDFSYYRHNRKIMFLADTGAGEIIQIDRSKDVWEIKTLAKDLVSVESLREVDGKIYCVSNKTGNVTEIDPLNGEKRIICNIPGAFWIDYDSENNLLVCTDTRRVYRIHKNTGAILLQIIPTVYLSKVIQPWITIECDRTGCMGDKDALYIASVQGVNGTHVVLRVGKNGESLGPWFGWPIGAGNNSQGDRRHCSDPDGHYPWTAAICGQDDDSGDAVMLSMGKAETNGKFTVAIGSNSLWNSWKPMTEEQNSSLGKGRMLIYYGTSPTASDVKKVPSFNSIMNGYCGGLIDADYIASMSIVEAAKYVREGMLSTIPRPNIISNDIKSFILLCHANSQQYLIEGAPYMNRIWNEVLKAEI